MLATTVPEDDHARSFAEGRLVHSGQGDPRSCLVVLCRCARGEIVAMEPSIFASHWDETMTCRIGSERELAPTVAE